MRRIMLTRFNNDTWEQLQNYRRETQNKRGYLWCTIADSRNSAAESQCICNGGKY